MRDLLELRDATAALLRAVPNLDVHVGEADQVRLDPDGRAHPYAVLWASPGARHADALAGRVDRLVWSFQVTAAGGDDTRALWAVGRVLGALSGVRLFPEMGVLAPEPFDPGTVRVDRDVTPHRSYVPLLFAATSL